MTTNDFYYLVSKIRNSSGLSGRDSYKLGVELVDYINWLIEGYHSEDFEDRPIRRVTLLKD